MEYVQIVSYNILINGEPSETFNAGFQFHPKCAKLNIDHLCFVDDSLLFARGDVSSMVALKSCFQTFSQASVILANLGKISVHFGGVKQVEQNMTLHLLGFSYREFPKYLGVPRATKRCP